MHIAIYSYQHLHVRHTAFVKVVLPNKLFLLSAFEDDAQYTNLQAILVQESEDCEEVFLVCHKSQQEQVRISQLVNSMLKDSNLKSLKLISDTSRLNRLLQTPLSQSVTDSQLNLSVQLLASLELQLNLAQNQFLHKQFSLKHIGIDRFMRIDSSAFSSLSIFERGQGQVGTLVELLDRCRTKIGKRRLRRLMRQPSKDPVEINQRLDKVQFAIQNQEITNQISTKLLRKVPDLDSLLTKIHNFQEGKTSLTLQDCVSLRVLGENALDLKSNCLVELVVNQANQLQKFIQLVEKTVVVEGKECIINSQYSKQLKQIDNEIKETYSCIDGLAQQMGGQPQIFKQTIVVAVKKKEKQPDMRVISVRGNKILTTTPQIQKLAETHSQLKQKYLQAQKVLQDKLFQTMATFYPVIQTLSELVSELDVIISFAHLVIASPKTFVRPRFADRLVLRQFMHPCLLASCVGNDCELSKESLIIITGPNMGGKSTFIRAVALNVYMAHLGCFVPAQQALIPVTDAIITRVGASDKQMKGISTFMNQMLQLSTMFKHATASSLLLIDQLGRGTSTADGLAIARAVLQTLVQDIKARTLFATHFHQLSSLSDQYRQIRNLHTWCIYQGGRLQMKHQMREGATKASFGVELAQSIGLGEQVIADCRSMLNKLE